MLTPLALQRTDHESDHGRWTLLRARPPQWLAPYVREIQGYVEERGPRIVRKEVPSGRVPLILVFGPGFSLYDVSRPHHWRPLGRSFVAGIHEHHAVVGSKGDALCMQVDLTPWGARHFLRTDMDELAEKVVDLNAILGPFADRLEERLAEAQTWEARFEVLGRVLAERILRKSAGSPLVRAAWDAIEKSQGAIRIGQLASRLDCSRKHLLTLFRRDVGVPPKTIARILRFERAITELQSGWTASFAELAASCGYADQAHFNRDFLAFAGESPGALRGKLLPDGTGIMVKRR
jgi:AraC-like DNA-binding protein